MKSQLKGGRLILAQGLRRNRDSEDEVAGT